MKYSIKDVFNKLEKSIVHADFLPTTKAIFSKTTSFSVQCRLFVKPKITEFYLVSKLVPEQPQ